MPDGVNLLKKPYSEHLIVNCTKQQNLAPFGMLKVIGSELLTLLAPLLQSTATSGLASAWETEELTRSEECIPFDAYDLAGQV